MATSHSCPKNPDRQGDETFWAYGSVDSCDYHGQRVRNMPGVRWGKKARAKMDRETGTVGQDYGGGFTDPRGR